MRVLVFGGRGYNQREKVHNTLTDYHAQTPITLLIHGACENRLDMQTGEPIWSADMLAQEWAQYAFVPYLGVPAVWYPKFGGRLNKKAGPERNALMLIKGKPQAAIGFPGGKGSADMANKLKEAGIPTIFVDN